MASSATFFNNWKKAIGGAVDLNAGSYKVTLHTSTYAPNVVTQSVYADTTNEVGNTNGYTTGGATLGTVAWTLTVATAAFTAASTVWTASGGTLGGATLPRYAVVRAVGTFNAQVDPLIMYVLLDVTPADVTVTVGNTLTIQWSGSGIFSLA
jgi:hypothetical protein